MKEFPIPVRSIGPGSQDDVGEDFSYMPIPHDAPVFAMPQVPENADATAMAQARELLGRFILEMAGDTQPRFELLQMPAPALEVLNQTLGEGEVSIRIAVDNGSTREIRVQETVFAGVWRERHYDPQGELLHDYLLAAPIPPVAIEVAREHAVATLPAIDIPGGAMNSPALLTELRAAVAGFRPNATPHVLNLTLLPLTPEDVALLDRALPPGPVAILSRGFGNCRISSTALRHVWRVQYFNSMQTLILNTLEVVTIPEVALAAEEDLADSRERLAELHGWMGETENA